MKIDDFVLFYWLRDEVNPQREPIKLKISNGNYGLSIEVLHPKTNEAIASASLDYFQAKVQLLGYAMLPDGTPSQEVTSQEVLVVDYLAALSKGMAD